MTRRPVEPVRLGVAAEDLPKYTVLPNECAVGCGAAAAHQHHVVRRSMTAGPKHWVLIDGEPVMNLVPLCFSCHNEVTGEIGGYKAWISYEDGSWFWNTRGGEHKKLKRFTSALAEPDFVPEVATDTRAASSVGGIAPDASGSASACPTCGRKPPKPKAELEPTRPKVNFNVKVPKDAIEDGHAILTELFAQARELLGREEKTPNYFVLVEVLYGFITDHGHKKAA